MTQRIKLGNSTKDDIFELAPNLATQLDFHGTTNLNTYSI